MTALARLARLARFARMARSARALTFPCLLALAAAAPLTGVAGPVLDRIKASGTVRVCIWSDYYGITFRDARNQQFSDIDKPGVLVGVQAGTFMEPVMGAALKQARMVVVQPPATRERELEAGRIDVFMTDYPYSRRLLDNADWAELIAPPAPFHVLPYAYAVKPGDDEWFAALDAFVRRIQRDGRLEGAAQRNRLSSLVVR